MKIHRLSVLNQGDLCPHCGFIIVMPPDLDPICMSCGKNVLEP